MATLTRVEDSIEIPDRLPVVALRDLVFFPYIVLPILIGRRRSVAALEAARAEDGLVLLVAQKDPGADDPGTNDLFRIGTIARVVQVSQLPDGTSRVVLEGLGRARIRRLTTTTEALRATVELLVDREAEFETNDDDPALPDLPAVSVVDPSDPNAPPRSLDDLCEAVRQLYGEYARMHERIPEELSGMLSADGDRIRFAHLVAGHLILPSLEKQEVLEEVDLRGQLGVLREMLVRELEILRIERKLDRQIQLQLGGRNSPFDLGQGRTPRRRAIA